MWFRREFPVVLGMLASVAFVACLLGMSTATGAMLLPAIQ